MSKTEILAELPRLAAAERAEIQAKLDELARQASHAPLGATSPTIATPRLADPRQVADFRKRVKELESDAAL
jgi:hypothetical protein